MASTHTQQKWATSFSHRTPHLLPLTLEMLFCHCLGLVSHLLGSLWQREQHPYMWVGEEEEKTKQNKNLSHGLTTGDSPHGAGTRKCLQDLEQGLTIRQTWSYIVSKGIQSSWMQLFYWNLDGVGAHLGATADGWVERQPTSVLEGSVTGPHAGRALLGSAVCPLVPWWLSLGGPSSLRAGNLGHSPWLF